MNQSLVKDLAEFAEFANLNDAYSSLATLAEEEDWNYHNTKWNTSLPILRSYIRYTYIQVVEQMKVEFTEDATGCCFNTGLVTAMQEPIYADFELNKNENATRPWFFKGWLRHGQSQLNKFPVLPQLANYIDDPTHLILDLAKEIRVNVEHIITDNRQRFPEPYKAMENYALQTFLKGAIDNAKERVRRNYKTAIPQFHGGEIQLLLPLCLGNPRKAELALVIQHHNDFYRAATALTLDMAYNNARLLAKPERDWLQP